MSTQSLKGQTAIITGASRGIGRCLALKLAEHGVNVVVAAKSTEEKPSLPGTIFSVAKEVEVLGAKGLPIQVDVRDDDKVKHMVHKAMETFGRIDIMINNAGALWWKPLLETPMKRFDLMHQVNVRASFLCTQACLPHMLAGEGGHILMFSPPVDLKALPTKVGYLLSKFGMTMIAHGLAGEMAGKPLSINALWPKTAIESQATMNFKLGSPKTWRKPEILADCVLKVVQKKPGTFSGHALIDEDFLRSEGVTDFARYRCDPDHEPPAMGAMDYPERGKA